MPEASCTDINATGLAEISAVKGQLTTIILLIESHHAATDQRIDDMRRAVEGRLDGIEKRLGNVEANERITAIRTAGIAGTVGTAAGALVAAAFEVIRRTTGH